MKTKPRLLSVSLAAVLSVSLLAVQPASALTVFDPSNFVQNTLTAVRTLEQINNQINQLQNEAQMLMNQARTSRPLTPKKYWGGPSGSSACGVTAPSASDTRSTLP